MSTILISIYVALGTLSETCPRDFLKLRTMYRENKQNSRLKRTVTTYPILLFGRDRLTDGMSTCVVSLLIAHFSDVHRSLLLEVKKKRIHHMEDWIKDIFRGCGIKQKIHRHAKNVWFLCCMNNYHTQSILERSVRSYTMPIGTRRGTSIDALHSKRRQIYLGQGQKVSRRKELGSYLSVPNTTWHSATSTMLLVVSMCTTGTTMLSMVQLDINKNQNN